MKAAEVETPWLTTEEAAVYMRRSPETLKRWRWQGQGPRYYKQGKGPHAPVVYNRGDLDEHIRSLARYSTTDSPEATTGVTAASSTTQHH